MSDEKKETYADISAELRDLSRSEKLSIGAKNCEPQPMVGGKPIGIYFAELADRIEAAIERDRTSRRSIKIPIEVVPELVGNAAAIREALAPFPSLCEWLVANAAKLGIGDMVPKLRERMDRATAALSAPARNCDSYTTAKEAWDAYDEWTETFTKKCEVPPYNEWGWLFAPAEKGGAE